MKILAERDGVLTEGELARREFSSSERMSRGMKVGGALFAVALVTVFVPVLHFVLPPLFLILALIFGFAAWHDRAEFENGRFECPSCHKANELGRMSDGLPKDVRCQHCQISVTLKSS